jgi:hypothetical protein
MIGQGRTLVSNDEHRFDEEMRRYCDEARSLGYFPSDFLGMLDRYGAVAVAKKLIMSGDLQTGLRKLAKMKRLDLSIESLMLEPGFRHLFSKNELASAEFRLRMAETEA